MSAEENRKWVIDSLRANQLYTDDRRRSWDTYINMVSILPDSVFVRIPSVVQGIRNTRWNKSIWEDLEIGFELEFAQQSIAVLIYIPYVRFGDRVTERDKFMLFSDIGARYTHETYPDQYALQSIDKAASMWVLEQL